ncbi:hypothetical protein AB0F36_27815 [Streptomyces sp. NPDC029080]|uniref:hypothetical protein n=1 Tax=Streptomyces sp. NPDC029080 TaxID=3155017 RepID=UPI0033F3D60D
MRPFETGQTVVRREVYRSGRVWNEHALRVVADTGEALVAACAPGAETRWPALYVKARDDADRSARTEWCPRRVPEFRQAGGTDVENPAAAPSQ